MAVQVYNDYVSLFKQLHLDNGTAFKYDEMDAFFYRDYEYHAFRSVYEYLNHSTNFKDHLVLQVVSLLI